MKRVLYYSQGKIEIFNDFLIKYKLVKNETIVSYFLLVADNYFYRDHYNMSDDQFNYTYHKKFLRLYESSQAYHEELQYSISPIIYKMTNKDNDSIHTLGLTEMNMKWFDTYIRKGYTDIKANIVKRVFILDNCL